MPNGNLQPGDVVVRSHSSATILKRRIYRVTQVPFQQYYGSVIEVVDPWGKKREFNWGQLDKLDRIILLAEQNVADAEQVVNKLKLKVYKLREEAKAVSQYFPAI